jgi:membrane protease subunit HflK
VWLASGFYIVVEATRGVVLTFGKFAEETHPGLRWRLPWPIQSHEIVNLVAGAHARGRLPQQRAHQGAQGIADAHRRREHRRPAVRGAVPVKDAQTTCSTCAARRVGDAVAETAMREVIGKSRMDAILYETQVDVATRRSELMQAIHDRYKTGIT